MRDQAAPETLGAERDELVSNVLLGGAKLTAGATGKDGSGSDKRAVPSPPAANCALERVLALLIANDAATTDFISRLTTHITNSLLPNLERLMARYEKCNVERERLYVRYKASVDQLVAAAGQANTDGWWYGPVRREWRRNFVWYWGRRLEHQSKKTRHVGDECRQAQDALEVERSEAVALEKLDRDLLERDGLLDEEVLQLVILSKGA